MKRTKIKGFSSATAMLFVVGFGMTGVAVLSLASTQTKMTVRTEQKFQADNLAKTGADVLFDNIRNELNASGNYPFTLDPTSMSVTTGSTTYTVGTYEAKVEDCTKTAEDIDNGSQKVRRTVYNFVIFATGTAANGTSSKIKMRFRAYRDQALIKKTTSRMPTSDGQIWFPVGAIVSNTTVDIKTNQGLRTYDLAGQGNAHILANDGISWTPSGAKSGYVNPNILDIQGQYLTPQGGPYDRTVSPTGIGNSNGTKNYRNPALAASGSFPGSPADNVLKMSGPVGFPGDGEINTWKSRWYNTATGANSTAYANLQAASAPSYNGFPNVVRCPAIINGDLDVSNGQTLRLMPRSTNPWDNVIYVTGDVKNKGQLLNLGVTLVVLGKYSDGPSAEYKLDLQGSPFANMATVMQRSSMMCLNESPDAISISTNSSATTGLMFAMKGGINVTSSNAELTGMLVSGGTGANGGVNIAPGGGNSFVVKFDPNVATGGDLDIDPNSVIDVSWIPDPNQSPNYWADRPYAWRWLPNAYGLAY